MRNFKLILEYDGSGFNGWQTQSSQFRTIQRHLEEQLAKIFKTKINCQPSGRTDSGVHALAQVAHFKVDTQLTPQIIHKALNSFLDRDVSVLKVQEVPLSFHSQKNVVSKTYRYTILNRTYPSALWRDRAYVYPEPLNVAHMRRACRDLKGTHNFKAFQAASEASHRHNTIRTITELTITQDGDFIHITITADGFLYKMVRNIVGTLLAIGSGRISRDSIDKILASKDRKLTPKTAPSHGLCLISVKYKNS